jgi:hypothetical protein
VSIADVTPDAVLEAVEAGCNTLPELAERFEVLPSSRFLTGALRDLEAAGLVRCPVHPRTGTTFTSTRTHVTTGDNR